MSAFFKNLDLSAICKKRKSRPRKTVNPFPMKLYTLLQQARDKGWEDIVSWAPDGLSFHVHDVDRFVTDVLPAYFNQTQFKSFQRQLNFYNFTRTSTNWQFAHRYLIRGNQEMCKKIIRSVGQDKSGKESSSTSSSPSTSPATTKNALTIHQPADMHPLPLLSITPPNALSIDSDAASMFEQYSLLPDLENISSYLTLADEEEEDQMLIEEDPNYLAIFDDTPIALDEDAYFGENQCHLLSGEIFTV